ncbi:unnamed protein product [Trichogramma brassicae]|uniref:ATP-dependent DNA helicase RecQ zinc-binding domain-containing protein n=1 Tax=Trichogramma brassicae TaxID=86971 RepID=A0A6H5IIS6_9HYME|nr:unnamed protein product [Trichogramma brassicae]
MSTGWRNCSAKVLASRWMLCNKSAFGSSSGGSTSRAAGSIGLASTLTGSPRAFLPIAAHAAPTAGIGRGGTSTISTMRFSRLIFRVDHTTNTCTSRSITVRGRILVRGNVNRTITQRRHQGSSPLELRELKISMIRDFFAQIVFLENLDKCRHGMIMNYYENNAIPVICANRCDNCELRRADELFHINEGYNIVVDFIRECHSLSKSPVLTMNVVIMLLTGEQCDAVQPKVAWLPGYGTFMMCRKSIVAYLLMQALERKLLCMDFVDTSSDDFMIMWY